MSIAVRWTARGLRWEAMLSLVVAAGCTRSDGVVRLPVHGAVVDAEGEKIDGSITFLPDQGRSGPSAIASLVKGDYRFNASNGPTAGPHRVIVTRTRSKETLLQRAAAKARATGSKSGGGVSQAAEWKFSREIPANGPFEFDFKLP
jgi:hypothetical protein